MSISQNDIKIFGNLFVLEAANNHCGDLERGLKLIRDHAVVARQNNVRAAVKLQFRKMDTFVHPDYKGSSYNVKIEWENGEVTYEPLDMITKDDPVTCAIYARKNNLLNKPG